MIEWKVEEFCQKVEPKKVIQWINGGENIEKLANHCKMCNSNKRVVRKKVKTDRKIQ